VDWYPIAQLNGSFTSAHRLFEGGPSDFNRQLRNEANLCVLWYSLSIGISSGQHLSGSEIDAG
jgi:hypothetical protein